MAKLKLKDVISNKVKAIRKDGDEVIIRSENIKMKRKMNARVMKIDKTKVKNVNEISKQLLTGKKPSKQDHARLVSGLSDIQESLERMEKRL